MKSSRREAKYPEKKSWQALEGKKTYNVCVTCMKKGKFKVVNETNHYYGKAEVYSDMLAYCYSLQVTTDGEATDKVFYICDKCIMRLRAATDFRKQIELSQKKYHKIHREFSLRNNPGAKKPQLISDSESEGAEDAEDAPEQGEISEDLDTKETVTIDTNCSSTVVKTTPGKDVETSDADLGNQKNFHLPMADGAEVAGRGLGGLYLVCCPACHESFRSVEELSRHTRIHDAAIYPGPDFPQMQLRARPFVEIKKEEEECRPLTLKEEADMISCEDGDIILVVASDNAYNTDETDDVDRKDSVWDEDVDRASSVSASEMLTKPRMKYKRESGLYACRQCPYTTLSCSCLREHITTHQEKPFLCEECGFACRNTYKLRLHQLIHNSIKPYACDECQYSSRYMTDLNVHKRLHSDIRPYTCEMCGKCFRRLKHLKQHKESHEEHDKFKCERCDFTTKNSATIKKHLQNHDKPHKCNHCDEVFDTRAELTTHRVTVHDVLIKRVRPTNNDDESLEFPCDTCNLSFKNNRNLAKHQVSHSEDRPFSCDDCSLTFKRKTDVYKHRLIHSGHKPFACKLCPFASVRAADLRTHFRKHSDLRPYPCSTCPLRFRKKDTLARHLVTHSDIKPYLCTLCGFKCKTSEGLKRHIRMHEGPRIPCDECEYSCLEPRQLAKHKLKHAQDKSVEEPAESNVEGEEKATVMVQWVWDE